MTEVTALDRGYPRALKVGELNTSLRLAVSEYAPRTLRLANRLKPHDLLFLRRDITQPKVVAAWLEATRAGSIVTVVATSDDSIVGCATVVRDELSWSRHVGELRVIVDPSLRGKGLGQALTEECFAFAVHRQLEKLTSHMTVDQRAAIDVFEGLGFRAEALLRKQVKDRAGQAHDIVILSQDVAQFRAQRKAYGFDQAA